MSKQLTSMQNKILQYIEKCVNELGYPPSVREIGDAVGLKSPSTVHTHLRNLEKLGLIRRDSTKPRAIGVTKLQEQSYSDSGAEFRNEIVEIPILGKISAGTPIPAYEDYDEYFPLPAAMIADGQFFMLKIQGYSMKNAGILDGDYVIIRSQKEVRNGDMAACLIGDEATVKTFYKEKDHIRLQPENDDFAPILLKEVEVIGLVTGVIRTNVNKKR